MYCVRLRIAFTKEPQETILLCTTTSSFNPPHLHIHSLTPSPSPKGAHTHGVSIPIAFPKTRLGRTHASCTTLRSKGKFHRLLKDTFTNGTSLSVPWLVKGLIGTCAPCTAPSRPSQGRFNEKTRTLSATPGRMV